MALGGQNKARMRALAGRSLAGYIRLVARTAKTVHEPPDLVSRLVGAHPFIMGVWHGQFLLVPLLSQPGVSVRVMVARHGDAEVIAEALRRFPGVDLIRGAGAGGRSRDRGGSHALRASVRALDDGATLIMTADVPPGPARRAGSGIITLARLSGRPIIPVAAASSRFKSFDTWSRMTVNLPFGKVAYVGGDPIHVPREADAATQEALRQKLEDELNRLTVRAYELSGGDLARAMPHGAPGAPPPPLPLRLKAYRGAMRLAPVVAPSVLAWRERQGKEEGRRRGERLGVASAPRPLGSLVWLHAASVGEVNAILPTLDALAAARPDLSFLLTTGTTTSARLAAQRLGARAVHQYLPLDAPQYVNRFLDHWRPDLAVFTESEIWPNLVLAAQARGIPLALVNARMSSRSFDRWRRNLPAARPLFSAFDVVLAQNDKLARWLAQVGAREPIDGGNLKIDSPPPPADPTVMAAMRQALNDRPVFLAASTHEGEDEIVIAAHRRMVRDLPGLLTIIAPRHPERGTAIAELAKGLGLAVTQRSLGGMPGAATDIYVADTIGELGSFYALAPVAFVGGSLAPRGGQNPIEPVRLGSTVIVGPNVGNFYDAYRALARRGGIIEVTDADTLAVAAARLLTDPQARDTMRTGATAALERLSGALALTVERLLALLPVAKDVARAD